MNSTDHTKDRQISATARSMQRASSAAGTNGLAIASLITAFLLPVIPIILGHIARAQIRRTGQGGDGLALAGLVIGYFTVLAPAAVAIVLVVTAR